MKRLTLSTIQSLDMPDEGKIPSRPTITGQYRQQYTISSPSQITFTAWLESGTGGQASTDVERTMRELSYLKENRIKFNMVTGKNSMDGDFLQDLVIESIHYKRDASNRNRQAATITCTQIQLVDLTWSVVDNVDIFGYNIFTGAASDGIKSINFQLGLADDSLGLSKHDDWWLKYPRNFVNWFFAVDKPIPEHIAEYINAELPNMRNSYFFQLTTPIDLAFGPATYRGTARFGTKLDSENTYYVELANVSVRIAKTTTATLTDVIYAYYGTEGILNRTPAIVSTFTDLKNINGHRYPPMDATTAIFDMANTYRNFTPSGGFEHLPKLDEVTAYLRENADKLTTNTANIKNAVVYESYDESTDRLHVKRIQGYKIGDQYECHMIIGSHVFDVSLKDGFNIQSFKINTSENAYKPKIVSDKYQKVWDDYFREQYELYVVTIVVGTKIQIYLMSPSILKFEMVASA